MLAAAFTSSKLINAEYSHTSKPRSLKFAYGLFHRLGHHYHLHRWSMWQKVIKSSITYVNLLIIWTKEMNKVRLAYYFWACSSSSLQNPRFSKLMNCLVIWTQCTVDLLLLSGIRIQSWQSRGDTKALGQSIYSSCICYTSVIIFSNIFFVHELYATLSTNRKLPCFLWPWM